MFNQPLRQIYELSRHNGGSEHLGGVGATKTLLEVAIGFLRWSEELSEKDGLVSGRPGPQFH